MKAKRSIVSKMGLPLYEDIRAIIALVWPTKDEKYGKTIEIKNIAPVIQNVMIVSTA